METELPEGTAAAGGAVPVVASTGPPVLSCEGLCKHFGGVKAVDDVTLAIPARGLFGLCGFNGAGKSTLFSLLAGSMRADSGVVRIGDREVTDWSAMRRARFGVARTWQTVRLATGRSVADNVAAGGLGRPHQGLLGAVWKPQTAVARRQAWEVLERLGIAHLGSQPVESLTLEAQRLTELARALISQPKVLLADEPASGLSGSQREVLASALRAISEERAVMVVEHDLDLLASISEHIWVMVEARVAFSGGVPEFRRSEVFSQLRGISTA